jgi:hypothetical protein
MISNNRKVYAVIGTTGSGKTYFVVNTLLPEFKNQSVIILDRMNEYGVKNKYKLPKNYISLNKITDLIEARKRIKNAKIIYKININNKNDFLIVCQVVLLMSDVCLVIDEIANYEDKDNNYLDEILRCGRHHNQSVIVSTQCPIDIPPTFRQNITAIYFFQILERRYLEYCQSIIGNKNADKLIGLKLGEYVKYPDCVLIT